MVDLIRRADLIEVFKKFPTVNNLLHKKVIEALIEDAPVAYNVDSVVAELETLAEKHMAISEKSAELGKAYENHTILNGGKGMAYENAIDIVRKGGVKNEID